MYIYLERYGSTPQGTFGELIVGEYKFFTVEKPWENNAPFISCIPEGDYLLKPYTRANGDAVFALVNAALDITYHQEPNSRRYEILIHKANTANELAGCIAPGLKLGFVNNRWAVLSSSVAMNKIMQTLSYEEEHRIVIRWQKNGGRFND